MHNNFQTFEPFVVLNAVEYLVLSRRSFSRISDRLAGSRRWYCAESTVARQAQDLTKFWKELHPVPKRRHTELFCQTSDPLRTEAQGDFDLGTKSDETLPLTVDLEQRLTALRWLKKQLPHAPNCALRALFRKRQVRVLHAEDAELDSAEPRRPRRISADKRLSAGMRLVVPNTFAESHEAEQLPETGNALIKSKDAPMSESEKNQLRSRVLYLDEAMIIINKPPGLAVQGGSGTTRHLDGMLPALMYGAKQRPRLVHRLDRDTSGTLLLARTALVAGELAALFRHKTASASHDAKVPLGVVKLDKQRTVQQIIQNASFQRTYWALVQSEDRGQGRLLRGADRGLINLPLEKVSLPADAGLPAGERMMPAAGREDEPGVMHALTMYTIRGHCHRTGLMWLELHPLTGRKHQLRVHCSSAGVPIVGDWKYGWQANPEQSVDYNSALARAFGLEEVEKRHSTQNFLEEKVIGRRDKARLYLHCRHISLPHPTRVEGDQISVTAPLPSHMASAWDALKFKWREEIDNEASGSAGANWKAVAPSLG
ncbi:hypothetical protein CYMTET_21945 [Cymbomonas tetramitiformis]|uniref:Pseudouridine synthase RsuA/RluA-like domain-containing protein n=1 Tax=Cymbomonas tetramitiformis TaxID=36881 RepID=A0AAE0G0Y3_9CHLO|nr:hypothetical protein CYMTET_21945 [Cymbomonas tetramitiformis]